MLSGHPGRVDLFAPVKTWEMEHIALAHDATLTTGCPGHGQSAGQVAMGMADDLLSTLLLVSAGRAIFPGAGDEHTHVYQHGGTTPSDNAAPAAVEISSSHSTVACKYLGRARMGRLAEPEDIMTQCACHMYNRRKQ